MKAPEMKKTPTALKWLAEKRARIAGAILSCEQVTESLQENLDDLRQQAMALETLLASAIAKRARMAGELAALDQVVKLYDENIDPELIEAINGWAGNYGRRGALHDFLLKTLQNRYPDFVTTTELETLTITKFSLVFVTRDLRKHWYDGSFRNILKRLATQGTIERGPNQRAGSSKLGKWRWKQEVAPTLKELWESAGVADGQQG